jgi:hypothetical protein
MTRTTRLLAGLLAALVTTGPAGVHAVTASGEAASASPKPASTVAEKAKATAKKVTGGAPSRSTAAAKTGAGGAKGAAQKTASPTGKKTASATTTKAKTGTSTAARAGKRSTASAKRASTGTAGVTAAAVRSSGLLAREETGASEALCYRRTTGRGRCEPQCLPYTRCRSGIDSCRTGHENGPVTWFQCEQSRGNTSLQPGDGTILVLGRNKHNMPTGHTLYVERVAPRDDGRYDLVLSHTNYDRRCNLETNVAAVYDKDAKTIDMQTGNWAAWGRDLKVAGFILN